MNLFVGEFPPPYGGVAIKDKILYCDVYKPMGVKMINLVECKWRPYMTPFVGISLLWGLATARHVIIGVGTDRRRKIIMYFRRFLRGRRGLNTTIMHVMGGRIQRSIETDLGFKNLLSCLQSIWVETDGMKESLEIQGFTNVNVFPNCRTIRGSLPPREVGERIKYVYFSRICAEKGVDEIIKMVDELDNICLDFYGEIDPRYKSRFLTFLDRKSCVNYHGIFDSAEGDIYSELNQYDVLLFPTSWSGEGVPGILVESKMAGITAYVSDWNYNSFIVKDGIEGIVLSEGLEKTMRKMTSSEVMQLKIGAYESRMNYCIENFREALQSEVCI